jgi:hypothetical protein
MTLPGWWFGTIFVLDKSLNALELTPIGRKSVTVARFVTGWTLGFGATAGGGAFTRMFPSIDSSKLCGRTTWNSSWNVLHTV